MKKITATITRIGLSSLALVAMLAPVASAADQKSGGQALEIAPPVLNLRANPGQTVTAKINLRDVSKTKLIVRNQINDFIAGGEDGTPKLLLDASANDSPYSLKRWIQPLPEFTLNPKEINDLPVTISVPNNAAPGGYYAVVRFTASPPDLDGTGVSLSASLGALVLLRVNGNAKESMAIEQFSASKKGKTGWLFESTPVDFLERIKNTGNLHEQPTGQVSVKDMFGKKIAAVNVNLSSNNVLPGSIRKFSQPLDKTVIGDRMLFGRYTAELTMKYGSGKEIKTLTSSTSFWVIPYTLIAIVIGLLIAAFIGLRIFIKRYNERIISKSRSRRRR